MTDDNTTNTSGTISPLSGNNGSVPNSDANDDLPVPSPTPNNYIQLEVQARQQLFLFKWIIFVVGIVLALTFLGIGLKKSSNFLDAHFKLASDTIDIQKQQLSIEKQKLTLIERKLIKPKDVKDLHLQQDQEEKPFNNRMLSTGIILTLISIIFAVGLTIMMSLVKHSFHHFEAENSEKANLVTPASDLIKEIFLWFKEKFSSGK